MRFEGIITPVVTPHRDDHSIDHGKFAEVLEFLIDAGIHAAVIAEEAQVAERLSTT